jgi:hypothetical protein
MMRAPCSVASLEQPCPLSFTNVHDSTGVPWSTGDTISWSKAVIIIGGCAVGGFIGGVGVAALVSTIIGRRAWDALTGP